MRIKTKRAKNFGFTGWRICVRVGNAGAKAVKVADTDEIKGPCKKVQGQKKVHDS